MFVECKGARPGSTYVGGSETYIHIHTYLPTCTAAQTPVLLYLKSTMSLIFSSLFLVLTSAGSRPAMASSKLGTGSPRALVAGDGDDGGVGGRRREKTSQRLRPRQGSLICPSLGTQDGRAWS